MSATVLAPSGREVSLVKAVCLILRDKVDSPEKIPLDVAGTRSGQLILSEELTKLIDVALANAIELTRAAKMRLPPSELVHSEKAFQNTKEVIGLYLRDHPEAILQGFTRAQLASYYTSMSIRERVDAGAPHKLAQTRIAELKATGHLTRNGQIFKLTEKLHEELKTRGLLP